MSVAVERAGLPAGALGLRLTAPRAHALVPEVLDAMHRGLDAAEAERPEAIVLMGGANFCSGGDIAAFHAAARAGTLADYGARLVPGLQRLVLRLLSAPYLVGVAARGAITGGGAGLVFAADVAVLSPDAFVQPYYSSVGFGPDGGWCAVLPERIGMARTQAWLARNARKAAPALHDLGLASDIAADGDPDRALVALLENSDIGTLRAAKSAFWTTGRLAHVEQGLGAETAAFLERLADPAMPDRLAGFLAAMKDTANA